MDVCAYNGIEPNATPFPYDHITDYPCAWSDEDIFRDLRQYPSISQNTH
jgi:hypothetical protein